MREWLGDLIGVICIVIIGYGGLWLIPAIAKIFD